MELRYFQIIVPIVGVIFLIRQIRKYLRLEVSIYETVFTAVFWIFLVIFSFFPDYFSNKVAKLFGIKDNVNAVIFLAIGLLFYFQLKLYRGMKKQEETITALTRRIALDNPQQKKNQHSV